MLELSSTETRQRSPCTLAKRISVLAFCSPLRTGTEMNKNSVFTLKGTVFRTEGNTEYKKKVLMGNKDNHRVVNAVVIMCNGD